jgi:hypothetical protein
MLQAFEQAAKLNDDGINACLQGNPNLASQPLARALRILKAALVAVGSNQLISQKQARIITSANVRMHTAQTVPIRSTMVSSDTIVFNQAIRIIVLPANPDILGDDEEEESRISSCIAIVVFNLALASHLSGTSPYIIKAERLYGMVLGILDNCCCFLLAEDMMRIVLVIRLVCISNRSQIRYSWGDCDNANRKNLLTCISAFYRQGSPSSSVLLEESYVRALLLVFIMQLEAQSDATAAAA